MSLRLSMILSIAVLLLATLLLGGWLTYLHAQNKVKTEMEAAIAVGSRIARNSVDDVESPEEAKRRLNLLVADFDGDRHLRAELQDLSGEPLWSSRTAKAQDPAPVWFRTLLGDQPRAAAVDLPKAFDGLGKLVLHADSRNEIDEVWSDVKNTLTVLAAFCSMMLATLTWMIGRTLRPLEDMSRAFAEIGGHDFRARIPEVGPIELRRVYHGFNEMAGRLAQSEEQMRLLQEQLATVQEEERSELARDLHDEIGSVLFAAEVDAASAQRLIEAGRTREALAPVGRLREALGSMQKHVREMLSRLRRAPLLDAGLALAIENQVDFWRGRQPGICFSVSIPAESYGELLDGTIFRIVQESLSNAVRHGQPKNIEVSISEDAGMLRLEVTDDGGGFADLARRAGHGIDGMHERTQRVGGELSVENRKGAKGVRVLAVLPLSNVQSKDSLRQIETRAGQT
jgi:two-component system sensor histidine kinase UhpB